MARARHILGCTIACLALIVVIAGLGYTAVYLAS